MRPTYKLFLFLLFCVGILSCHDDDKDIPTPDYFDKPSPDSLFFNTAAEEYKLELKTNLWVSPEVEEGATEWCEVSYHPSSSNIVVRVKENQRGEPRETLVKLKANQIVHNLYIRQLGHNPVIQLFRDTYRVAQSDTCLAIPFIANVTVEHKSLTEWITVSQMTKGQRTDTLYLDIAATREIRRTGEVELSSPSGVKQLLHIIQQSKDTIYEGVAAEGYMHKLAILRAEASEDLGDITLGYDGNEMTAWGGGTKNFPVDVTFYFEKAERVDKIVYSPGTWGFGPLKRFEIHYRVSGETNFRKYDVTYDFKGDRLGGIITFPEGIQDIDAIRFHVLDGIEIDGKQYIAIAKMEFYGVEPGTLEIFTDLTCSELRKGVTYEQIEKLDNSFIRHIAQYLYSGIYPLADRVNEYEAYSEPSWIEATYKITPYNRLDNATGIYVENGEELVVMCGETFGKQLKLCVMDWESGYSSKEYTITEGYNQLNMTTPGLVYLLYYDENPETAPHIKVHIATGRVNGKFVLNQNTDAEWEAILSKAVARHLDVLGENAQMVMPVSAFREIVSEPSRLLRDYDRLVYLERELMGLYKYEIPIKNRMFFQSIKDSYMYATHYRTAYNENTLSGILDVEQFESGESIWGPAHEVGHMHQTRPGLKWDGLTEVTNNIYALYVQTSFGIRSRLLTEKIDGSYDVHRYEKAFTSIIAGGKVYNVDEDVFCKLVPFWQLQLYATKVAGCPDFYPDLHQRVREMIDPVGDEQNGVCQMHFVEQCCELLQQDLTDFFQAWGFLKEVDEEIDDYGKKRFWITGEQVATTKSKIAAYPKLQLGGIIYLNDENISLFKENKAVVQGTVSRSGQQLTLSGWKNAVAYELWEGDRLVLVRQRENFKVEDSVDWSRAVIKAVAADGTRVSATITE